MLLAKQNTYKQTLFTHKNKYSYSYTMPLRVIHFRVCISCMQSKLKASLNVITVSLVRHAGVVNRNEGKRK